MIFLSYSTFDRASTLLIKSALEAGGFRCWMDKENIRSGERWAAVITRAIRESSAMIVVLSERSKTSNELGKELTLALRHRITVIPLRLEDIGFSDEWDYHFANIQVLDAFGGRLDAACKQLVQDLRPIAEIASEAVASAEAPSAPDTDLAQAVLPLPQAWWWEHLNAIDDATVEKGAAAGPESRTGRHKRLWYELTAWLADLSRIALGPERWDNKPNQFQIGRLSYTYWARIFPDDGRAFLRYDLHIGVQLSKNKVKWVTGIDSDVGGGSSQAVMALWGGSNDRGLARMVNEKSIRETYGWVQQEALLARPELRAGLVRDQRGQLMRATTYLARLERGEEGCAPAGCRLWSPLITLEMVRNDPAAVSREVSDYLRLLAEPVRVARAAAVDPAHRPPCA